MRALVLLSVLAFGGCGSIANTSFDNIEASRYVDVSVASDGALARCADSASASRALPTISSLAISAHAYSAIKGSNDRITSAGKIIVDLAAELNNRYALSVPSIGYCQLKLKQIGDASRLVATSIAKKED